MRYVIPILLLLGLLSGPTGCATPGPQGPVPLYEFDSVWLNPDVGGVSPWKQADRRAASRAAQARENPTRARRRGRGSARSKSVAKRSAPKPTTTQRSKAKRRVAATRKKSRSKNTAKHVAPRPAPVQLGPGAVAQASPRRAPRKRATKSDLGDGSVASELVAAARRLVGLNRGRDAEPFLSHLMHVAAVKMKVKAPRDLYNAAAWRKLNRADKTLDGAAARPGDLVFFHDTHDRNGDGSVDDPYSMVAVVETVKPSGALICVGDAYNRVIRFSMNATRPGVRRDDRSGEVMNTPIRKRSRKDGPETPVLAGQLYAGMARL
jgi:hypothetical protein